MNLLWALLFLKAFAAPLSPGKTPHILWIFTSSPEKLPSPQANIVTSQHPLFLLYTQNLKNYEHDTMVATVPRIEHELQKKRLVCYPGSSESQRRRKFSYLTSQYIQPSPQLVTTKETAKKLLNNEKSVRLQDVLKNKNLRGVIGKGRSFGPSIDKILNQQKENTSAVMIETFGTSVLKMIKSGRASYSLEYSFILKSLFESHPEFSDLVALSLSDIEPVMTQYLACSKTPEGLKVIQRADELIRQNVAQPSYWRGVIENTPLEMRKDLQKEIDRFISERRKAPVIIK